MVMSSTFNAELHRRLLAADLPPTITQAVESQRAKLAAIEPMSNTRAGDESCHTTRCR